MSLLNNNTFNRSLVSLAVGIGRDPQAFQANFNRFNRGAGIKTNNDNNFDLQNWPHSMETIQMTQFNKTKTTRRNQRSVTPPTQLT